MHMKRERTYVKERYRRKIRKEIIDAVIVRSVRVKFT